MGKYFKSEHRPKRSRAKKDYVQNKPSTIRRRKDKIQKALDEKTALTGKGADNAERVEESEEDEEVGDDQASVVDESVELTIEDAMKTKKTARKYLAVPNAPLIKLTDKKSYSRLVYPNPVCFLSSLNHHGASDSANVMVLSWLMPTNNYGGFAFTMHKSRHSATNLFTEPGQQFVLSVPTVFQKKTVLEVGKCSGKRINKFDGKISGLETIHIGKLNKDSIAPTSEEIKIEIAEKDRWLYQYEISGGKQMRTSILDQTKGLNKFAALNESESESEEEQEVANKNANDAGEVVHEDSDSEDDEEMEDTSNVKKLSDIEYNSANSIPINDTAIANTVARMKCRVVSYTDASDPGHYLVLAQIEDAFVHPLYWQQGHCFVGASDVLPPCLSFLGSQRFGLIVEDR
jgi:flavin reductase (DIM6/NTAB) family NADH-FMN oxidoreductase RutF